jgi:hypothetical protein
VLLPPLATAALPVVPPRFAVAIRPTRNVAVGRAAPVVAGRSLGEFVGIDGYYYRSSDTFSPVSGRTIAQIGMFSHAPVLITQHSDRNNITRIKRSMLNQIQQIQSLGVS